MKCIIRFVNRLYCIKRSSPSCLNNTRCFCFAVPREHSWNIVRGSADGIEDNYMITFDPELHVLDHIAYIFRP
jgi:hypothetical protein